ncbi:exonuclease 3'-5' domain-containing protein 2-like [Uloborus diversus]|uniref:exonuclease 3'-5' domain-containing protein 2-like n=1 Tax=Uloborus diversus TaxID=327109 RepID=UPI00240A3ECE|nr:exonuclease 3'-5' domain-containing protein 2-like [Uloborus diversus]
MNIFQASKTKLAVLATLTGIVALRYLICRVFKRKKRSKCIIIDSIDDWNNFEAEILETFRESAVIGIDCEWVTENNRRIPISLLQLATNYGYCVLIRLFHIPVWLTPPGLVDLLKDRNILKVGVGVKDDIDKLYNDYCLEVYNFLDVRHLAKDLPELAGKGLGLKTLSKVLLRRDLNKSYSLRCSDWNADKLSTDQLRYAADDAIVSAQIFQELRRRKYGWFSSISWLQSEISLYCDVPFKQTNTNQSAAQKNTPQNKTKSYKEFRYSKPRQKPMYDNCQLVAPDGELLCSCDKGKAEWYVEKGLGEVIKLEDPFTVRLTFEPSGRPKLDNIFYTQQKDNCCVVCGRTDNFHRKLVVPSEYRKYFPNLMKKNLSHDVLLLCVICHKRSNILDHRMRMKLEELCDAPLMKNNRFKVNPELSKVKSAAKALLLSGDKIPDARKSELEKVILDHYEVDAMSAELLDKANNIDAFDLNEEFIPHGLKVYQYFCKNGGLLEFEKMWRQHFLDTMQPKFLPYMWSVEHNHKRLCLQVVNHERDIDFDVSILGLSPELLMAVENMKDEDYD